MVKNYSVTVLLAEEAALLARLQDVREGIWKLSKLPAEGAAETEPQAAKVEESPKCALKEIPTQQTIRDLIIAALGKRPMGNKEIWEFVKSYRPDTPKSSLDSRLSQIAKSGLIVRAAFGGNEGKWMLVENR